MRQLKNKTTEKTKTSGLYSRKVFNHFENPHNYGRMEKPDGVGKVGNLTCLLAGQNIHTSDKLTKIEELKQKDRVLTDKGCYSPIKKLIVRNYYGKIVKIKNKQQLYRLGKLKHVIS